MLDRLDPDERKRALRELRDRSTCVEAGLAADRRRPPPVSVVFFGTPEAAVVPFEALLAAGLRHPARRHPARPQARARRRHRARARSRRGRVARCRGRDPRPGPRGRSTPSAPPAPSSGRGRRVRPAAAARAARRVPEGSREPPLLAAPALARGGTGGAGDPRRRRGDRRVRHGRRGRRSTPARSTRVARRAIGDDETAGELHARLVGVGADLLVATLPRHRRDRARAADRASRPTPTS